ncbi:Sterol 3-beta-glucosyltransferase [Phytophthora palmivora]|uniref:Sterol 3-beta-glucosyltransferase n=1 Tax=Phytophthora palmivora TaxID=4796 RepID=A0A2P4XTH2_9STRA|nr:Sterol 3-beta-glucosyltransferase [Phytophthora palmivora]
MGHNVEFYPLGGDPKELAAYMVKTGGHLIPLSLEAIQKDVPRNMQMIEEIIQSTWPAVSEADPDGGGPGIPGKPFRAQAIIANPVSYGHIHVAERLGVPLHIMFPQPWVPTTAFPHPLSNMPYTNKPKKVNYMTYKLVDLLMWQGTEGMVNTFRTEVLELRKIRKGDGGRDILLDLAIPHAFMWSPHLVPKLKDWGQIYDVIGTVTLDGSGSSYSPTPEFETFLGKEDCGPIFVGFGSMVLQDPNGVTNMIIKAAEQAHVRVLIQSSWSDMAGGIKVPDNIFFVGSCPHDWLMPRVSAVVHHGGAGLQRRVSSLAKPSSSCRSSETSHSGVEPSWTLVLSSPELRKRAIELRDLMRQEDGAGEAVRCFYSNLPVHLMRCDLDCGRAAMLWSQKDKLRLCNKCEFVVTSRPENSPRDIVEYTYVDYSGRGPDNMLEGASSGVGAMAHAIGSGIKDVFVKPTEGYREEGAKGAVVGLVKGLGGLMISPLVGTMIFADHLATGAYNNGREKNEKKRGSLIKGNNKFLDIMGFKSRNVHTSSMNTDEVVDGSTTTVTKFLEYVHHQVQHKTQSKPYLLNVNLGLDPFSDMDDLRELVFSLWPALFGHTVVAERLGIPLHCMSDIPQSKTEAFGNLLNSSNGLSRPYSSAPANVASYDVVDKLAYDIMGYILDEFRYSLGLTGKTPVANLLTVWRIPHTYLWNPVLLPKPHDWRSEITVAGYTELKDNNGFGDCDIVSVEHELRSFTENHVGTPIIYFGFQCDDWDSRRVQELMSIVVKAALTAGVCIIFQGNKIDTGRKSGNDIVFKIDRQFPVKRILSYVHSTVHWGDLSITSTCLAAAKPACVIYRNTTQRLWGQALASSGAGVRPLDMAALTPSHLFDTFHALIDPKLADCAKRFAPSFSSSDAIKDAVSAFYTNLPLHDMTCDLDPTRIARVYDSVHELKLSYEARLAVHQITGDGGSAYDLKYKPLKYSQRHPPKVSLRQLDTKQLRSSSSSFDYKNHPRVVYMHDPASEYLEKGRSPRKRRESLLRGQSMALNVIEMPKYWSSPEEQAKSVEEINSKYEHLLCLRESHRGSSLTSSGSSSTSG